MVDPFPTPSSFDPDLSGEELKQQRWLRQVIARLFPVLKDQARFKAIDLARAANVEVCSRFLIAPSRRLRKDVDAYEPLASAVLDGFGGFLSHKFRDFDYQLGRRNCQQFLRRRFVLQANNPLFEHWPKKAAQNTNFEFKNEKGESFRTIIPLIGSAQPDVELPPWPSISQDLVDKFMVHVKRRINKLVTKVSREEIGGTAGIVAHVLWWCYQRKPFAWVRSLLLRDLIRGDQHEYWHFLQDDVDRLIVAALFDPNTHPRTAEAIARGINRYCHGRVDRRPLTANDVGRRLKGNLAKYVMVSTKTGKECFQIDPVWLQPRKSHIG